MPPSVHDSFASEDAVVSNFWSICVTPLTGLAVSCGVIFRKILKNRENDDFDSRELPRWNQRFRVRNRWGVLWVAKHYQARSRAGNRDRNPLENPCLATSSDRSGHERVRSVRPISLQPESLW